MIEKETKEIKQKNYNILTPEEIKEKIVDHLKSLHGLKISIKQLWRELNLSSYPTILKWTSVLIAEKRIQAEHYGNIKIVYVEDGKEKE